MNKFGLIILICFACISLCLAETSLQTSNNIKLPVIIADLIELLEDFGYLILGSLEFGYIGLLAFGLVMSIRWAFRCFFYDQCDNISINFNF